MMSKRASSAWSSYGGRTEAATFHCNKETIANVPWERLAVSNEWPMDANRSSTLVPSMPNISSMTAALGCHNGYPLSQSSTIPLSTIGGVGVSQLRANDSGARFCNDLYDVNRIVDGGAPIGHTAYDSLIFTSTPCPLNSHQVAPLTPTLDLLLLQAHLCHHHQQQQQQQQRSIAASTGTMTNPGRAIYSRTATMTVPGSMSPHQSMLLLLLSSSSSRTPSLGGTNGAMMMTLSSSEPRASSVGSGFSGASLLQATGTETVRSDVIPVLPRTLIHSMDELVLSSHQVYLREQIEYFQATHIDVATKVVGRTKRIVVGQVGIRCRHCAHAPIQDRQVGSAYFPTSIKGLYQAAQNMCTSHLQCGRCLSTPDSVKDHFKHLLEVAPKTGRSSMAGRAYWAQCAKELGLVDTNHGIFVLHELPQHVAILTSG